MTKRENSPQSKWKNWNWRSNGDLMLNGAFFTASGAGASSSYARASSLAAKSSSLVSSITASAGSLSCRKGSRCWAEWMIQEERTHPILLVYDMIYYIVIKANNACQVTACTYFWGKKVIQLFCICNFLDIFSFFVTTTLACVHNTKDPFCGIVHY